MKGVLKATIMVFLLCLLFGGSLVWASQTVRVVQDLGDTQAEFSCQKQGSGEVIGLSVPAIALNDVTVGGKPFKELSLPVSEKLVAGETNQEGLPSMPILTSLIILPENADPILSIQYSSYETIENVDIAPTQPPTLEGEQSIPAFTQNESFYSQDIFYPEKLADFQEPAIMRDIRFSQISISPVQYNPARRELRVYHDLSVSVAYDFQHVTNPQTIRRPYLSEAFYPLYKSLFANFDEIFTNTEVKRGGYVILTKPMFVDSLAAFANWKHRKGYTVRIVPTTEINTNGNPTAAQIRTFLTNAYNTWDVPPEYIMIVGDQDNTSSTGIIDYPYSGYTSDHQYSMLAGTDYLPDAFVARLSIDNMTDFRRTIAKVIAYETTPNMSDTTYWHRGLSVAGNINSNTPRIIVLWARQMMFDHGFSQVDTVFDWGGGGGGNLITASMNRGVAMVNYRGWAGPSGWYNPSFDVSSLNAVQNTNKLGVMASIVCGTGDYGPGGVDPCFGETWVRMGASPTSFKGGPAFYGITDHSTHTQYNNPNMVGYIWGIFGEKITHFAAATVRGKMQLYRTFPGSNGSGSVVNLYFNTCNALGDPEVEVRTMVPIRITVSHPDSLALGVNHIEINVTDTLAQPLTGLYVTLTKGYNSSEEVFKVGQTDETGRVALSFAAATADTMFVTVSGGQVIPYKGIVQIVQSDLAVGYDSLTIDDDISGFSFGNDDGIVNPGETVELGLILKNFGSTISAHNVQATLETMDPELVSIFDAHEAYGNIDPGQLAFPASPYVIKINESAQSGDLAKVKLSVTDSTNDFWYSVIELPIVSPKFSVTSIAFQDSNSRLDPGDSLQLSLTIRNVGQKNAEGVEGKLLSEDDYTRVIRSQCSFGNMAIDSSATSQGTPLILKCSPETFNGRSINLALEVTTSSGEKSIVPFTATVGLATTRDPSGPDAYGYYMYDNTDTTYAPHPTYSWVEINPDSGGAGIRLNLGSTCDDKSILATPPFDIRYYGQQFNYLIACTNGFVAFDTSRFDMAGNFFYNFFNWPIPDPGNASGQISPFWDDLQYATVHTGIYTWNDSTEHRFVIEWSGFTNRNTSARETFEMIFYDPAYYPTITGDASFVFQYRVVNNNDSGENYASVGFESPSQVMGLQYTFANRYLATAPTLAAGRAILVTTNTGRGGVQGGVELNNGGNNSGVTISASTGQQRTTGHDGIFWLRDVPPGIISLKAESPGYFPESLDSIVIAQDQTTTGIRFNLTQCMVPDSLTASETFENRVEVRWHAVVNPRLTGYNIYRSRWQSGEYTKLNSSPISGTLYTDSAVPDTGLYWYSVKAIYTDSSWSGESFASNSDCGRLFSSQGIAEGRLIPETFSLSQNYPNPFNPTTTISFGLPKDSQVKVEVYNLLGQKVKVLFNGLAKAGYKSLIWDGKDNAGKPVSSGVYFYRIDAGSYHDSKKMMMLK